MNEPDLRAKKPVSALAGPYGHPLHPMLVAVPIGAWIGSFVFDLGSHVTSHDTLATGALWLVALGVLGALAAATLGFLDLFAIPTGTPAHRTALVHMTLNLAVTAAYALNFWWRTATGTTGAVPIGPIVLSLVSLGALSVSGYLGGKLAYRYGVRVAAETVQAEGFAAHRDPVQPSHPTSRP